MRLDVRHDENRSRYEIDADGQPAGFLAYRPVDDRRCLTHIEVDDIYSGHGVATTLVEFALLDAKEHGVQVLPGCPFVRGYIVKHREYLALVPLDARARYGLGADNDAG